MAEIKLNFRGVEYVIPDNRAFELGERLEQIARLDQMLGWQNKPEWSLIGRCLGEMLRFAGAKVSDREVKRVYLSGFLRGDAKSHLEAVLMLVSVLMDGASPEYGVEPAAAAEGEAGKADAS